MQPNTSPAPTRLAERPLGAARLDAAARLIARRGDHQLDPAEVMAELEARPAKPTARPGSRAPTAADGADRADWELIDACYARTAQALAASLLRAETAPGTGLDRLAVFLVSALEFRRERGALLSFRRGRNLPTALQRRLHEHDQMLRVRLKRLLDAGRRDGSLARRNPDSVCELILASLQVADVAQSSAEQRMWDSELLELLLAAIAEPHPAPDAQDWSHAPAPARRGAVVAEDS